MPGPHQRRRINTARAPIRFGAAAAIAALAILLRFLFVAAFGPQAPFITFYPAVMVSALLLGFGPGLLTLALSGSAALLLLRAPRGDWTFANGSGLPALVVFLLGGIFLCVMAMLHQRARNAAAELAKDQAVRETLDRLHHALRSGKAGTWEWDLRTGENIWSEELWSIYGLEPFSCQPSYAAWKETIVKEDQERVERQLGEATRKEADLELEWRVKDRDGAERWLHSKASPERDPTGKATRYVGVVFDVTDKKRTEVALKESESKLQAALDSMSDAIFISDTDGRFLHYNDAFVTFHRFKSRAECANTFSQYPDILEVFLPDGTLAPVEQWAVPRALRGETAVGAEYTLRRKDTGETWIGSYSLAPIRAGGAILGSVVAARDVTEERSIVQGLAAEHERLAVTLRSIGDAVIATDPQARITLLNNVAETLTGWTAAEAIGRPLKEVFRIVSEKTHQPSEDPVSRVLREGTVVGLANNTLLFSRDGTERPIADSGAPILDAMGRTLGVVLGFATRPERMADSKAAGERDPPACHVRAGRRRRRPGGYRHRALPGRQHPVLRDTRSLAARRF